VKTFPLYFSRAGVYIYVKPLLRTAVFVSPSSYNFKPGLPSGLIFLKRAASTALSRIGMEYSCDVRESMMWRKAGSDILRLGYSHCNRTRSIDRKKKLFMAVHRQKRLPDLKVSYLVARYMR
jgi:hypothetical protein